MVSASMKDAAEERACGLMSGIPFLSASVLIEQLDC
jgi:hypothetical protein